MAASVEPPCTAAAPVGSLPACLPGPACSRGHGTRPGTAAVQCAPVACLPALQSAARQNQHWRATSLMRNGISLLASLIEASTNPQREQPCSCMHAVVHCCTPVPRGVGGLSHFVATAPSPTCAVVYLGFCCPLPAPCALPQLPPGGCSSSDLLPGSLPSSSVINGDRFEAMFAPSVIRGLQDAFEEQDCSLASGLMRLVQASPGVGAVAAVGVVLRV